MKQLTRWSDRAALAALMTVALTAACAPRVAPVSPGPPRYPNYLFPAVPQALAGMVGAAQHQRAWELLQAGNLQAASDGFAATLTGASGFYPATVGLGYVDLAARRYGTALARFGEVLTEVPSYASAWVGRGEALLGSERETEALEAYESALVADPSLDGVRRRIEVLRFRSVQNAVLTAQQADAAGRYGEAREAYELALTLSPDSGLLYRGLASVERALGLLGPALDHVRRANELEPDVAAGLALQGDIHETLGDLEGAERAYASAYRVDPSAEHGARLERIRARVIVARLPPAYRAIPDTSEITRAELASLIGVRLEAVLKAAPRDESVLITDTRGHWAAPWVQVVSHVGVMEVFANHTFQPDTVVQRGELAQVVSGLLTVIGSVAGAGQPDWRNARLTFADLDLAHLRYLAASVAVASGVLPMLEGDTFQLTRVVSGREAIAAVDRLAELVNQGT